MRRLVLCSLAMLITTAGCDFRPVLKKEEPGPDETTYRYPGTGRDRESVEPNPDKTFRILPVKEELTVTPGGEAPLDVVVDRGRLFRGDVTLRVEENIPSLRVDPAEPFTLQSDDPGRVRFLIKAVDNAALGTADVTVVATPPSGVAKKETIKVVIQAE